jgi:hypothetical protein
MPAVSYTTQWDTIIPWACGNGSMAGEDGEGPL